MRGLRLPRSRSAHRPSRPYRYVVSLLAALALLAVPGVASAANGFTEQVASARWSTRSRARMAPRPPTAA
jgi:hypothetical protein